MIVIEGLVSLDDGARMLGVSARTVRRMVGRGELPTVAIGGRRLLEPAALRDFIASHRESRGVA